MHTSISGYSQEWSSIGYGKSPICWAQRPVRALGIWPMTAVPCRVHPGSALFARLGPGGRPI